MADINLNRSDVTLAETYDRPLPHDIDAERAVLGAILVNNSLIVQIGDQLQEDDFFLPKHQKIYSRMIYLFHKLSDVRDEAIDELTLKDALDGLGLQEPIGLTYLSTLRDGVPRLTNIANYVDIIRNKALLRKLISASQDIIEQSHQPKHAIQEILKSAETRIFDISQRFIKKNYIPLTDALVEAYRHLEYLYKNKQILTGIPTGYRRLDMLTCGLQKEDLIILAARPSMGKTSFAMNIAMHAALEENCTVAIFSLEMSARQLALRLLSSESMIDAQKIRSGFLSPDDWAKIGETVSRLDQAKLFIDETANLSVLELQTKARRLKREVGLDLIVVDYLQLISPDRRYENRVQEIAAISRTLKALAKDLEVPVLALSQLSRAPEARKGDHRPHLSDLRESGSLEQDADVVMFIFREEWYNPEDPEVQGLADIIVEKQRNGPTGTVRLSFQKQFTRFFDLAADVDEPTER